MRARAWVVTVVVALAVLAAACSDDDAADAPTSGTSAAPSTTVGGDQTAADPGAPSGVGMRTETFVDTSRATPASRDQLVSDERVLDTVIWYPTHGDPGSDAEVDADPASDAGPFPLVVFSHGLGGSPENIENVADDWVRAGFVVAAPRFPLSRADHPGGPDAGDVQNQTGDVSFLITTLTEDLPAGSPLQGLIDGEHVGVAGHSNGAITTIGLTMHTCCIDERIDAAIEIAGTPSPFDDGEYDFTRAPALLVVHGTEDPLVNYGNALTIFNEVDGPKGLLTIGGGDHGAWLGPNGEGHDDVVDVTTNFFLAYLRDDADAQRQLDSPLMASDAVTLEFVSEVGSTETVPTTAPPATDRQVSATPTTGLTNGQRVTVTWSGFLPGGTINIVQCSRGGTSGGGACDLTTGYLLQQNPTGAGTVELQIVVGAVGDGRCEAGVSDCVIVVNDSGLPDSDATLRIPIEFAP